MIDFLVVNQDLIKTLVAPYTIQRNLALQQHVPIFYDDIQNQYINAIKCVIVKALTQHCQVTTEEAYVFVESFNVLDYLGVERDNADT